MRTLFILPVLLLFSTATMMPIGAGGKGSNSSVQFSVSADQTGYSPGEPGTLLFTIHPKKGIHINLEPGLTISADSSSDLGFSGKPEIPIDSSTNFLNESKPIRQPFRVPPHRTPDSLTVSGTVTYYYCSDAEGWCSRFKQSFRLKIRVTP